MRERIEHARRLTSVTDLCADSARLGLPPNLATHTEAHRIQCSKLVELRGLEPPRVAPLPPQGSVYCHFTTTPRRWCRGRDLNPQSVKARDFKSRMYANSTTPADLKKRCPILRFQGVSDCCMGTGKTRGTRRLRLLVSKVGFEPTSPRRVSLSGFFRHRCSLWAMPRDCGSQRGLLKTHAALPEFRCRPLRLAFIE